MKKINPQKRLIILSLIGITLTTLLTGCGATNQTTQPYRTQYQNTLNDTIAAKWQAYGADKPNFGGGIAVYIMSPKGNYYASYHMPGGTKDSHFRAASTTKTFTAAAIMLLHQQGKLNINDLITAPIPGSTEPYIPNNANYAIPYKNQITIKMLLGHRAGVFDVADSDIPDSVYAGIGYIAYIRKTDNNHTFTFDELVGVVADNNLSYFPPNTDYHYSNTGYNLLGKIIERISDQRYDQFMQNNFLTPNSLNQTSFPYLGTDQTLPAPFETGCLYTSGILENVTIDNLSGDVAEGNIITTPANLANWIRLLVKGESGVLPNTVALMKNGFNYGFGLFQIPGLGFGHNGAHAGYLTAAFHDPDQDVTVVISASVVDWADIINEMYCLYDIGRAAKIVLGYTAPATN